MAVETLLLDGRTQSLIENYVPEGEILEGLVSFFFGICGSDAATHFIGAGDHGIMCYGYFAGTGTESDNCFASVTVSEKYRNC